MGNSLKQIESEFGELTAIVAGLKTGRDGLEKGIEDLKAKKEDIIDAIGVLTNVLSVTQQGVVNFIEQTVGTCLKYVYDDTYSFKVEYVLKRNQPEVYFRPVCGNLIYNPKFSCGVGVLDVISFALQYVCWTLESPQTAPILIHDEPFRNVHGVELNERLSIMTKRLSDMLGVQIIIISGESGLTEVADKAFWVELNEERVSEVTEIGQEKVPSKASGEVQKAKRALPRDRKIRRAGSRA